MTTKCFEDKSNDSIVSKCESPDIYNIDETVPVTSVKTGRTYWNKHCAICNGDTNDLFQWTTKILLGKDVLCYFDATTRMGFKSQQNSLEELHAQFAFTGRIFYTPPVSVEHDRCIKNNILGLVKMKHKQRTRLKSLFFKTHVNDRIILCSLVL